MIPALQAAAYIAAAILTIIALVRRFSRLGAYVGLALAVDLIRLGIQHIPKGQKPYVGVDKLLFLLDGALFMSAPVLMAWTVCALRWPLLGLWAALVGTVALSYPELRGPALTRFYLAALVTGHVAMLIAMVGKVVREGRTMRREEGMMLVLLAVGLSGSAVALWRPDWRLVNIGNVVMYALLGLSCLMGKKTNEPSH